MSRISVSQPNGNMAQATALHDWLERHGWEGLFLDRDHEQGWKAGEWWQEVRKCRLLV